MTDWLRYRGGPRRTGALPEAIPERDGGSSKKWRVGIRQAEVLANGIRVANDKVYVGRTDGLSVLDAETGEQVWRFTKHSPDCGLLLTGIDQEKVILTSSNARTELTDGRSDNPTVNRTENSTHCTEVEQGGVLCDSMADDFYYVVAGRNPETKIKIKTLYHDAIYWDPDGPDIDGVIVPPLTVDSYGLHVPIQAENAEAVARHLTISEGSWSVQTHGQLGAETREIRPEHIIFAPLVAARNGVAWKCHYNYISDLCYEESGIEREDLTENT